MQLLERNVSSASNSLGAQQNGRREPPHPQQQRGGPSMQAHSTPLHPDSWIYTAQQLSTSTSPHHSQHPIADSSVPPSIIDSTSTLYDHGSSLQLQADVGNQPYPQWDDTYIEQGYGPGMGTHSNFSQIHPHGQYSDGLANTVSPSAANPYQQQSHQDPVYNSYYVSELLSATGSVPPTAASTPDSQQPYHRPTPDPLQSYAGTPEIVRLQQTAQEQQTYRYPQAPQTQGVTATRGNRPALHQQFPAHLGQLSSALGPQQHPQPPQSQQLPQPQYQQPQAPPLQTQQQPQQLNPSDNASNNRQPVKDETRGSNLYTSSQLKVRQQQSESQSPPKLPKPPTRQDRQVTVRSGEPSAPVVENGANEATSQAGQNGHAQKLKSGALKRPSPSAIGPGQQTQMTSQDNSYTKKRKRGKRNDGGSWVIRKGDAEFEESEEEGEGGIEVGLAGLGVDGKRGPNRGGACRHCKKLKMKCAFSDDEDTCRRCRAGGHVCIVEGRKPRTAPNKREYLLAQIRQKDAIIESLLKQLHNPYLATPLSIASYRMATSPSDQENSNVLGWLDRLQSSVQDAGNTGGPSVFTELRNKEKVESDGDSDGPPIEFVSPEGEDCDDASSEAEKIQASLPDAHVPLGLIANLSIHSGKAKGKKDGGNITDEDLNDDNVGVANDTYFMPGPASDLDIRASLIQQHSPPEILLHNLVNLEDVQKLFDLFYKYVNPFLSLLDPALHTPASTFARCPFLFTVVCAISSRYYTEKSEIYPIAMHFAKHSAANALIDGWKSVELCQAYILMSVYAVPAKRWEEDRSWLYTGLAIRIATDLNLHHASTSKPKNEKEEREILNRARVWMLCFTLDRSTATQFGKPSTIKEDYLVRNARDWYSASRYNLPYDVHLCAYVALLQIVAKFHDEIFSDPSSPSGLNKNLDFRKITMKHDGFLTQYHQEWLKRFEESSDPKDEGSVFRCSLLPFLVGYSRLVMFSFGFQQAFQRGFERGDQVFFIKCLDAAKSVIKNMIDGLAPSGYMRYAPDGHFVFASFASAFLLKLLRPEFASFLNKEQESGIFELIGRLIQTLSSPKIALDDRHTPKLYARFLAGLLSRYRRDGATVGRLHPNPPNHSQNETTNGNQIPAASMTTFSLAQQPPQNPMQSNQNYGYSLDGMETQTTQTQNLQTPIYRPEATYSSGTGPIHFGSDMELAVMGNSYSPDEEMLATMQAIKNPSWWQNMMMPGFSWSPDPSPSPPNTMGQQAPPPYLPAMQHQNMVMHGMHHGFSAFQPV